MVQVQREIGVRVRGNNERVASESHFYKFFQQRAVVDKGKGDNKEMTMISE